MSRQRVEVLLAVRALEPLGYGESVRCYLLHRGIKIPRSPLYRQLQHLYEDGLIKVARSDGLRDYLRVTGAGQRALHAWFRRLARIANV